LSVSKDSIKEVVVPDSSDNENLNCTTDIESDSETINSSEQNQVSSETQFTFYPSGEDFIKNIINERGKVEINNEMRERFNLFARDYRLVYMPDMNYYESFFESDKLAKSLGYNNFGYAVFYVLHYMGCPERMSAKDVQNAIQSLFVDKDSDDYESNYKDMRHQAYRELANYENGYYSPWPKDELDYNRTFYLLTGLNIVQEGSSVVYITVRAKIYYFNDTNIYEAGENEKWLAEKSKKLGIPDLEAAAKLIASGVMEELKGDREIETTIRVKFSGNNPYGYNPRFVSRRNYSL
jgi:hypothetical protein